MDHIGWDLWRAAQSWKTLFTQRMVDRGHVWFGEARGNLVHLIGPDGAKQSALAAKSQLTKQAVQQFLDELESDGVIKRNADPHDARGKIVHFTAKGQKALADADGIKREIEAHYEAKIGKAALRQLKSILDILRQGDE